MLARLGRSASLNRDSLDRGETAKEWEALGPVNCETDPICIAWESLKPACTIGLFMYFLKVCQLLSIMLIHYWTLTATGLQTDNETRRQLSTLQQQTFSSVAAVTKSLKRSTSHSL
ncbi:unnamed protein product [Protopolystoma xenopodis]|uniref:Uncharacterized protein n=1 Tax=Protopolystoma xenopodis TaxID=117903 RepID=A0A448WDS1_9PLAT|nr:unnamed protein product [Protopolystoma xenopodis]